MIPATRLPAIIIATALLGTAAYAQENGTSLSSSFTYSQSGDTDMKKGASQMGELSTIEASFAFDLGMSYAGARHSVGLSLDAMEMDLSNKSALPAPESMKDICANYTFLKPFDETWTMMLSAKAGWHNTGDDLDSDGFGVSAVAGANYKYSDTLKIFFGLIYDSMADDYVILPAIGIDWDFAPDWNLAIGMPKTSVTYSVNDKLSFSILGEGRFGTYEVDRDDQSAAGKTLGLYDTKLEYRDIRAGLGCTYALNGGVTLNATLGYLFERKLDYFDKDYEIKSDDGSVYGSFGLSWSH